MESFSLDPAEKDSLSFRRFNACIQVLRDSLKEFGGQKDMEIEARLGYMYDEGFETCVGQDFYNTISVCLGGNKEWEEVSRRDTTDKFADGFRLSEDDDGNVECIKKMKVETKDFTFSQSPFDVRVCFSKESKADPESFNHDRVTYEKRKRRTSYVYKSKTTGLKFHYDLTHVQFSEDSLDKNQYQIEIEIEGLNAQVIDKFGEDYILHSLFLKINDLVNMVEKIPAEATFEEI